MIAGWLFACAHAPPPVAVAPAASEPAPIPEPPPVPASALADDPYAALDAGVDAGAEPPVVLKGTVPVAAPVPADASPSPSAKRETLAAAIATELEGDDLRHARRDAWRFVLACGPEAIDRCREEGLGRLRTLAAKDPADKALGKKLEALAKADACLAGADRSATSPEACLAKAAGTYRLVGDKLMLQRALLAVARPTAPSSYPRALAACREVRCSATRAKALRGSAALAHQKAHTRQELTLRLRADRAEAEGLAPERRAYVRSAETDEACARYDGEAGEGRCRALERRVTGGYAFHDYAQESIKGDLPKEKVLEVNAHYLVTLNGCFRSEGKRAEGSATETYVLRWMIGTDGRVARFETEPPLAPDHALQQCLSAAFAVWRYPKSPGENQHVEQSFSVTATER